MSSDGTLFVYGERTADPPALDDQPLVEMVYRDDVDHGMCQDGLHQWVRSGILSGIQQKPARGAVLYWQVTTTVTWCWDCGKTADGRPVTKRRMRSAAEYYAMINPAKTSYQGVDIRQLERWNSREGNDPVHTDWEMDAFQRGGWVR